MKTYSFVLDKESETLLSKYAQKKKISISGFLRMLISEYCNEGGD